MHHDFDILESEVTVSKCFKNDWELNCMPKYSARTAFFCHPLYITVLRKVYYK